MLLHTTCFTIKMSQEITQRIIKHMNKDHQLALVDYVVVYGNVNARSIVKSSVTITELDEKKVIINYNSKKIETPQAISIDWNSAAESENKTVNNLKDVKGKLVSMAKYAAAKQGYSHKQITKVLPPRLSIFFYIIMGFFVLGSCDMYKLKQLFSTDPLVSRALPYLPAVAFKILGMFERNMKSILLSILGVHVIEVTVLTLPNIIKYRVPPFQKFLWCLMNLIEGFPVPMRFKTLINEDEEK